MTARDAIDAVRKHLTSGNLNQGAFNASIDSLINSCASSEQRSKLKSARSWADIYFSPRKWEKWGSREAVRDFVLGDLSVATMIGDRIDRRSE